MALSKNIKTFFCSGISTVLSMIIVFNLGFNTFHILDEEHHHSSEQNCSASEEIDACHRFLIHNEKSAHCDGSHEHFSEKNDDCFVCKFYKQRSEYVCIKTDGAINLTEYKLNYKPVSFKNKIQNYTSCYLRGPPVKRLISFYFSILNRVA